MKFHWPFVSRKKHDIAQQLLVAACQDRDSLRYTAQFRSYVIKQLMQELDVLEKKMSICQPSLPHVEIIPSGHEWTDRVCVELYISKDLVYDDAFFKYLGEETAQRIKQFVTKDKQEQTIKKAWTERCGNYDQLQQ